MSNSLSHSTLLRDRLRGAGFGDVAAVTPVEGGMAAVAGVAELGGGGSVFVKSFLDVPAEDLFGAEAEGLGVLREHGLATPDVLAATRDVLVLSLLRERPVRPGFWEELAHGLARLHTSTVHDVFGWEHDNWLGRYRQQNTWTADGYEFFAERRLLRWLPERRVQSALDASDRRALERLCARLPEILPPRPACLTHGDLWSHNVLATEDGLPAVIDPAVSYMWAEVDLAHLWCSPRPAEAARFLDVYAEATGLDDGWRERMPLIQLRQHLAVIAMFDHDWGAAQQVRAILEPFRDRS